ncbi:MAG: hypothetical protein C0626_04070 [Arcobacter sp.]|uniref:hypothetical protein n=1 Tax=uncultured Arcobacter sp. TaxID=165434 RepID=UPI000CB1F00D|nr:hypothetical protein [uncultured Arcobacter sp.]PLY10817.1 MAG: hypothetical protein C0626_04070 [Arcobacter sp.]
MSIKILTENEFPEVSKVKNRFDIFRVIDMKTGKLEIVEFFGKDGVFRGFGKNTREAFKKAKKVAKKYYKDEGRD